MLSLSLLQTNGDMDSEKEKKSHLVLFPFLQAPGPDVTSPRFGQCCQVGSKSQWQTRPAQKVAHFKFFVQLRYCGLREYWHQNPPKSARFVIFYATILATLTKSVPFSGPQTDKFLSSAILTRGEGGGGDPQTDKGGGERGVAKSQEGKKRKVWNRNNEEWKLLPNLFFLFSFLGSFLPPFLPLN